mgnify:CR=1 FL=1
MLRLRAKEKVMSFASEARQPYIIGTTIDEILYTSATHNDDTSILIILVGVTVDIYWNAPMTQMSSLWLIFLLLLQFITSLCNSFPMTNQKTTSSSTPAAAATSSTLPTDFHQATLPTPPTSTSRKDGSDSSADSIGGSSSRHAGSLSISQQSIIVSHRIRNHCKNAKEALELMEQQIQVQPDSNDQNNHHSSASDWEEAWYATLQLCGKLRDYPTAIHIVQTHIPDSNRCRAFAISICGKCGNIQSALDLLLSVDCSMINTPAPYNAAIAACGTNRAWKEALRLVQTQMPLDMVSCITCNAVLTALAKSQRGNEALAFLQQGFDDMNIVRDRTSYHHTIAALLGSGQLQKATTLVLENMVQEAETNPAVTPNQETYDRLIAAIVGRRNQQEESSSEQAYYKQALSELHKRAAERKQSTTSTSANTGDGSSIHPSKKRRRASIEETSEQSMKRAKTANEDNLVALQHQWDFKRWTSLPKYGKGKTAYWELGTFHDPTMGNIVVGLHPNRNPAKNGIQLWFFATSEESETDRYKRKRHKIGFLLMINAPPITSTCKNKDDSSADKDSTSAAAAAAAAAAMTGTSQFLGLKVTDQDRRQGWAKIFIAVWLQCCLDANLQPITGKMNKPLLCLVLQHAFGFQPHSGGVPARLLPPANQDEEAGVVRLSPATSAIKTLEGALSPRDIQEQQIRLMAPSSVSDKEQGRLIEVGGILQPPNSRSDLKQRVEKVLQDRWVLSSDVQTFSCSSERSQEPISEVATPQNVSMRSLFLGL